MESIRNPAPVAPAGDVCHASSKMLREADRRSETRIGEGGLREAAIRGLLYVGSARGMVDERSLEALAQRSPQTTSGARLTLAEFKMLVREQFFMLLLDREGALAAIPKLLPDNAKARQAAFRGDSRRAVRQRGNIG